MTDRELIEAAFDAMNMAYAPYSGCKVGAALLAADGRVFKGCNIENAAFGPTCCAERTAFFKAVSEGAKTFVKIAVCGGKDGRVTDYFWPCGVCRQVMSEFCGRGFEIITAKSAEDYAKSTLGEMLPNAFSDKNL